MVGLGRVADYLVSARAFGAPLAPDDNAFGCHIRLRKHRAVAKFGWHLLRDPAIQQVAVVAQVLKCLLDLGQRRFRLCHVTTVSLEFETFARCCSRLCLRSAIWRSASLSWVRSRGMRAI